MEHLKKKNKIFKVYDGLKEYVTHYDYAKESHLCGDEECQMPIVEIGFFEGKDATFKSKPKILITSGLEGGNSTSLSAVMNLIHFIGNYLQSFFFWNKF